MQVVTTGGIGVEKTAVAPVVVIGDRLEWTLGYANTDSTAIDATDLIDVLPHAASGQEPSFHGTASLAEPVVVDPAVGESVQYSAADPETISSDGSDPSNQPGGSTRWCDESEFGSVGCPASLGEVTAVRIQRSTPVPVGEQVTHRVAMATEGSIDGDRFVNRFGLRASNLALPVQSNPATIEVVAGSIGDRVWSDLNGDGLQQGDEPGVAGVPVELRGTDDLAEGVERATTTDADGHYVFDGLRPGRYTVSFTAPEDRAFTLELVGDDRAIDSDVDADGVTAPIDLVTTNSDEGLFDSVQRRDDIDAGLLTAEVPPVQPGDPVPSAGGSTPPDATASGATPTTGARGLATTGTDALPLIGGAVVLVLLGAAIVLARRRPVRGER